MQYKVVITMAGKVKKVGRFAMSQHASRLRNQEDACIKRYFIEKLCIVFVFIFLDTVVALNQ